MDYLDMERKWRYCKDFPFAHNGNVCRVMAFDDEGVVILDDSLGNPQIDPQEED